VKTEERLLWLVVFLVILTVGNRNGLPEPYSSWLYNLVLGVAGSFVIVPPGWAE